VAVDRTVRVEMDAEPVDGPLTVESMAEGRTWSGGVRTAPCPDGDAGAVLAALHAAGPARGRGVVDSRAFVAAEGKLGRGRSAATTAAAVAARHALANAATDAQAVLRDALAANAVFQDGQGSGADVAAAVYGGVVTATRSDGRLDVAPGRL